MSAPQETNPTAVSAMTNQVGDVMKRWLWTEPAVWNERMLTALEKGVQGGIWFSLIDKVWKERNLRVSHSKVAANQGVREWIMSRSKHLPTTWTPTWRNSPKPSRKELTSRRPFGERISISRVAATSARTAS